MLYADFNMRHPPTQNEARISEIFSSLQGEGTHLGEKMIFIRFEECNIHCEYCDELDKVGTRVTLAQVLSDVDQLEKNVGPHRFVSLTGGEPLLYLKFLKPLLTELKARAFQIYLETGGILWQALKEVVHLCDLISMDMKPSSVTKEKKFDNEHEKFLRIAIQNETFIKIVISKELKEEEFEAQVKIIHKIDPKVPLILQPISTPDGEGHEDPELMNFLYLLQQKALCYLKNVRIVPRFHRILNIK